MIAAAETRYAQNRTVVDVYRSAGNVVGLRAIDAQKGPTDEHCEWRNGRLFDFDDASGEMEAHMHPNCTLVWVPVLRGQNG